MREASKALGSGLIKFEGFPQSLICASLWLEVTMSDVLLLTTQQLNRIKPYFPVAYGVPRVDDRRVISGIIYVIRYGLQWKVAPKANGPHKTLYNRFVRWSQAGIFNKIFRELSRHSEACDCLMIDATHLKAHRTAASLRQKWLSLAVLVARKGG